MYKSLIKYNLVSFNIKFMILISLISTLITLSDLNIYNNLNLNEIIAGDIFLLIFGGTSITNNTLINILNFLKWSFPHIAIYLFIYISVNKELKNKIVFLLPRIGNKNTWFLSYNFALIIEIIKYYIVLFGVSLIILFLTMKNTFKVIYMKSNNFNNLIEPYNQFKIIILVIICSVLLMILIVCFTNNILLLFKNNNLITLVALIVLTFPIFFQHTNNNYLKYVIVNNGMLVRHTMFHDSIINFNVEFSIIYLIGLILINIIIGLYLIKRTDLYNIKNIFN